jgi:hypothetical protein
LKFHNKTIAILYSWLHRNLKEGIGWPGSFMSVTSDYKPNTTGVCLSPITPQVLRFLDTYPRPWVYCSGWYKRPDFPSPINLVVLIYMYAQNCWNDPEAKTNLKGENTEMFHIYQILERGTTIWCLTNITNSWGKYCFYTSITTSWGACCFYFSMTNS